MMFERFARRKPAPNEPLAETDPVAARTQPDGATRQTLVIAPVSGTVVALAGVGDQAFASGALGRGVGIVPEDGRVTAPIAGRVISLLPHAVGIESEDGIQVLIHIGIDTVNLDGAGFSPQVQQGDAVAAGSPLVDIDLDSIREAGFKPTTMVTVVNAKLFAEVTVCAEGRIERGSTVIHISHGES